MASGEEFVIRQVAASPNQLSVNKVEELNNSEKMDVIILSANPAIMSLWKFMEMEIIAARDEAIKADPSKPTEQLAKLTTAHAMEKFYLRVREDIVYMTHEHMAETQRLQIEKRMSDPDELERAFFQS